MLIIDNILYDLLVKLVWSALPKVCLLMKLESNALRNVLCRPIIDFGLLGLILSLGLLTI